MKTTEEMIAECKERITRYRKEIDRLWQEYDDCLNDWAGISINYNEQLINKELTKIELLEGDGCFPIDAIIDENGNEVGHRTFDNKWGRLTFVSRGVFASSLKALAKKMGYEVKEIRVPFWYNREGRLVRFPINMKTREEVGYPED